MILGRNGVGKTTMFKLLLGHVFQDKGNIVIANNLKIGAVIEEPTFYENLSAEDNLKYFEILYGVNPKLNELLKLVGLDCNNKQAVKKYSVGMRKRLSLARALINNPDVLILDEPLNGLDPVGIKDIKDLIKQINYEKNITILISSHLIRETEGLASHYCILHNGSIIEKISAESLIKSDTDITKWFIESTGGVLNG